MSNEKVDRACAIYTKTLAALGKSNKDHEAHKIAMAAVLSLGVIRHNDLAERFERMHEAGDAWITTIAAAAIVRQAAEVKGAREFWFVYTANGERRTEPLDGTDNLARIIQVWDKMYPVDAPHSLVHFIESIGGNEDE